MRLDRLFISKFRNLENVLIDFDKNVPVMVILGHNGVGKSSLIEALTIIFRDLELGESPMFKYQLSYTCRNSKISIDADPERSKADQVYVRVREADLTEADLTYEEFWQHPDKRYLPNYVFGYYSGFNNDMEELFVKHQQRFYRELKRGIDKPFTYLIYANTALRQFALLAFFIEQDTNTLHFLEEKLGILNLDSVLFVMKKPSWSRKNQEKDSYFWYAEGIVRHFLQNVYEHSLAPLRMPKRITTDFRSSKTIEHLYLYLKDIDTLRELFKVYGNQYREFFNALVSTYVSDILEEVKIRIKVRNVNSSLTFRDLSDGEQQLLMVFGLLRFTKEDEVLFLLDEPDTHLNPAWGIEYLNLMRELVGDQLDSQVIMTTHNPLVISGLEREQVRIMKRDADGQISVVPPYESPKGMGIGAILTSDLFGLRSTLDLPTQDLMDERRELAVDDAQNALNPQKRARLLELNELLQGVDFSINTMPDPLYHDFVLEMTKIQREDIKESATLTQQQRDEQRALTRRILRELREKKERQA